MLVDLVDSRIEVTVAVLLNRSPLGRPPSRWQRPHPLGPAAKRHGVADARASCLAAPLAAPKSAWLAAFASLPRLISAPNLDPLFSNRQPSFV
jgi:hypothetical protein